MRPATPIYSQSTANSLSLLLTASEDDGGTAIQNYVLQSSELIVTNWQDVTTYDGISLTHTMTTELDGLLED